MNTTKPHNGESFGRAYVMGSFRPVALELFGQEGLAEIARRLPKDIRRATIEAPDELTNWIPDTYPFAWYDAIWEGPAAKREDIFIRFVERTVDHGFGRVRRLLIGAFPPRLLLSKAPKVWSSDHTCGELTTVITGPQSATLTLRDHMAITSPLGRLSLVHGFRYGLSLSRTTSVTARGALKDDGVFEVLLDWT